MWVLVFNTIAFLIGTNPETCFHKKNFSYHYPFGLASNYYFLELLLLRPYCAPHNIYVTDVFVCGSHFRFPCRMCPAGRNTRVLTLTNDNSVSGKTIANFLDRGFLT